jgi:hypothetical protein
MRRTSLIDTTLHSHLVVALQMLDAVQQALHGYVETGSMADLELANLTEKTK